jgi:hypothetical protein
MISQGEEMFIFQCRCKNTVVMCSEGSNDGPPYSATHPGVVRVNRISNSEYIPGIGSHVVAVDRDKIGHDKLPQKA